MPFLTLEGIEGSGKSTQLRLLQQRYGAALILTQEPGGTAIGQEVRRVLLARRPEAMSAETELLLYFADRAQHVAETIRPALKRGATVVSDRYVDSSLAYQGYGRRLSLEVIAQLAQIATGGLRPDMTVLLDVPVDIGLARVGKRGEGDRLESERREFHERVRAGYHALVAGDPQRWLILDGSAPASEICQKIAERGERQGVLPGPRAPHGLR